MTEESTTPDLAERVREIFAAASRRDWDAIISLHLPGSVWDASRFEMGTFEGPEATRRLFEDWIDAYEDWQIELEEVVDLGNGIVFAINRQMARLPGSAAYLQARDALVFQWKQGMIGRVTGYPDIDEARAAAERLAEERR
jgi:ketosteroid isomerase-like protein